MWERGSLYLKKAGTVILGGCLVLWLLSNLPVSETPEKSYAGRLGKTIAPVFRPMGFDDWKVATGLVGGFIAKEIVIGTLGTLYSVEEEGGNSEILRHKLRGATRQDGAKLFTPLVAFSLMVFILLYVPCLATVAVVKRETNSWRWAVFAVFYTTAVAWIAAFLIYQGGRLLGF